MWTAKLIFPKNKFNLSSKMAFCEKNKNYAH